MKTKRLTTGQAIIQFLRHQHVERDGRRFWFGDAYVASALNGMIADLDELTEPGDRIVVGPADLSRTIVETYIDDDLLGFMSAEAGKEEAGSGQRKEVPHQ